MDIQQKQALISRGLEEVLTPEDLTALLAKGDPIKHYIGFEISGEIHLGTGIAAMQKVKDIADAGGQCTIFLADWHTWINDKLGGDRDAIKRVAVGYFKEGMRACYKILGGPPNGEASNPDDLNFVLGTDLYHHNDAYWETMIGVAKHTSLSRAKRSISILGREEQEEIDFAKLIYPIMQVADIFALNVNIAHAGMDQRKAHVIARDAAESIGKKKPVALHHHLLLGLQKESIKMSKSDPDSAIFITESPEEITRKVWKAYCPPKVIVNNPIIDWIEYLIFPHENEFVVEQALQLGGGKLSLEDTGRVKSLFHEGKLHPADLKKSVSDYLINFLAPIRDHFASGAPKEMLDDLKALKKK